MYNRNLQKIVEGPQNPPVKPLSGKGEVIEQPKTKPPQQTTPTGGDLAKQRIEAYKTSQSEYLKDYPVEKYIPYTNGTFDVIYKNGNKEKIYPSGRREYQNKEGRFFMGTYDGNLNYLGDDDAKTTYDKYGDKAWLSDEEEKELGIKKNPDTGKYEKIDQNQNTGGSGTSGTSGSSTPKKRGTQLSSQDFEGIDFKYKYPGDRNYRYGVKGTDWYAKNINNQKVFNITKDGFTSSVDKLNTQFPNAFKEVVQPVSPETKTPVTTQDSTKVVTNVPPVKPLDSTDKGSNIPPPVKPMDSTNQETKTPPQVKFVDSTAYKLEKL